MKVLNSAFKHGIAEADILLAFVNAMRLVEIEQYGEERLSSLVQTAQVHGLDG